MKLDLSALSKAANEMAKTSTSKSTDDLENGEPKSDAAEKYSYVIVTISELDLPNLEEETGIDQSALLMAVLKSEFFDDDFSLKHLPNQAPAEMDNLDKHAQTIDSWYSDNLDRLHAEFDFLTAMRPATISDLLIVGDTALLEITRGSEERDDFGVDLASDSDPDDVKEDEEDEEEESDD